MIAKRDYGFGKCLTIHSILRGDSGGLLFYVSTKKPFQECVTLKQLLEMDRALSEQARVIREKFAPVKEQLINLGFEGLQGY